jgi:putative transposase
MMTGMKKAHVKLTEAEREALTALLARGSLKARTFKRATGLLALARGQTLQAVAQTLDVDYNTVASWRDKYAAGGLDQALYDAPRSGRPIEIDGAARAKVTALACTPAPQGHARWGLKLLAEKAVELAYCDHLSRTQVGTILKKTNSSRT